uniref:WGS project CAEQ00000000 data, annotated contig 2434 n=1 Tax=Trypanosoma congolense (strain IL3000) TaxID=1068625 RepID=F9WE41_TRYCI|nr:unnamed protein product [Trypanosoma congolense IL3000]
MSRCSTASLATYDGPTGDVNTAFTHLVKRQLLSAPRTSVVRASPIYRAVVCHYSRNDVEGPRHAGSDDTAKSDVSKQFEKGKKAPAATVEEATTAAVAVPAVGVPAAVARRGVVLRDPLLLRKLRKQQSGTPSSPGCTRMAVCSSGQETGHKDAGDDGLGRGEDSVGVHWSKRSLHLMTAVGWDVFRP